MLAFTEIERSPYIDVNQGVAADSEYVYGISTYKVYKYDKDWNVIAQVADARIGTGIGHISDGCIHGNYLYLAAENYVSCESKGNMRILIRDKSDLSQLDIIPIDDTCTEASSMCIDEENGCAYVTNFCESRIEKYAFPNFEHIETITVSPPLLRMQGITIKNGQMFVSGYFGKIYRINSDGTRTENMWWNSVNQGIDFTQDYMYAVSEDGTGQFIHKLRLDYPNFDTSSILQIKTS